MSNRSATLAAIFGVVFSVHVLSPNATPFDSRWSIFTAHSLLHEGNADLNEFQSVLRENDFYAIECVGSDYHRTYPVDPASPCPEARFYNFYPIAIPALAAPAVFVLEQSIGALQPWLGPVAEGMPTAARREFLKGNLVGASMLTEIVIASLIVAATAVVMYLSAVELLTVGRALVVPFVFAFCTSAWSTGSRALWQHGPSMLLISTAIWLAIASRRHPRWVQYIGGLLTLAVFVRPTNVVPWAIFTAFVWFRFRPVFLRYLLWSFPVVIGFCLASWITYGTILAPYAFAKRLNAPGLALHAQMFEAFTGNMISPSRGLLIYTPGFLLCVYGIACRSHDSLERSIKRTLVAIVGCHWMLITLYEDWWGGHSFGPRYFSDLTPIFVYFLIPSIRLLGVKHKIHTAAFVLLFAVSFFIHFRGATSWATMEWNQVPANVRDQPDRIWAWNDLQFLRGLGGSHSSPKPGPSGISQ